MLLRTLGGLALERSAFQRPKPLLLLAYLSLEDAKPRRYLAELFYAGTTDPLNSLSRGLSFLRAAVPGAVEADGPKLRTPLKSDARNLLELLDAARFEDGVRAYGGPFLEGVDLPLGEELEEWVYRTRELLAARVRDAFLRVGERYAAKGQVTEAAHCAEAAYDVAGAPELEPEDFERTYTMLSLGGSPRAATLRREAAAFGLTLTPLKTPPENATEPKRKRHNLPSEKTTFVGREDELNILSEHLCSDDCRLVTISGPGGVGKSRLAVEVAYGHLERDEFLGGIFFVPLELLASAALVPGVLAAVFGLEPRAHVDLVQALETHIGQQPTLLIFDNCEHLSGDFSLLTDLLNACSRLTLLITSRERLHHELEWVFSLDGLPVPRNEGELFHKRPAAALQLFMERAKRAHLGFALTPEELPWVLRICHLVSGFPLGIELAAVWVGMLAPDEIAREIERDRNFLAVQQNDVPERHRSIQAVFESSWRRLTPMEQRVLRQLSVFRGGFKKAAAVAVSGVTIPVFRSLIDKSLLRVNAAGRYDAHTLLQQYMKDKLAEQPQEEAQAQDAHGRYYHRFLQQVESALRGAGARDATNALEEELENLRLAWAWALRRGTTKEIRLSAPALRVFFDKWGRFQEGVNFFEQALIVLRPSNRKQQAALGVVLVEQAWLVFRLGRRGVATSLAERGLGILRVLGDPKGLREGLHILGALRLDVGDYGAARQLWQEALAVARGRQDFRAAAHSLELLGVVEELSGNTLQAKMHYRESLDLSVHLGDKAGMVDALNNLSALLIDVGDLAEAALLLRRAMAVAHEVGAERVVPYLLDNLAKVAYEQREFGQADLLGQEALTMARDSGEKPLVARVLETLGRTALAVGDYPQADAYLRQSLHESRSMNATPHLLRTLFRVAELRHAQGNPDQAARLLSAVVSHPATSEPDRELATALFRTLGNSTVPKENVVAAEPMLEQLLLHVLDEKTL